LRHRAFNSFVVAVFAITLGVQDLSAQELFPFKENGKWGYINLSGERIVEPEFDAAFPFRDSITKVVLNGRSLFVNIRGEISKIDGIDHFDIIGPNLLDFRSGFKHGIANFSGDIILSPEYDRISILNRFPLYFDVVQNKLHGIANDKDELETPINFQRLFPTSSMIRLIRNDSMAFFLKETERYIPPQFKDVQEGFGNVFVRLEDGWHYYFPLGDTIDPINYQSVSFIDGQHASLLKGRDTLVEYLENGKMLAYNPLNIVSSTPYLLIQNPKGWSAYLGGEVVVSDCENINVINSETLELTREGKTNYCRNGRLLLPEFFESITDIGNGFLTTFNGEGWGLWNSSGEQLLKHVYARIEKQGNRIKALGLERKLVMAELDSSRIVDQVVFNNYRSLFAQSFEAGTTTTREQTGTGIWFRTRKGWGLKDLNDSILIKPQFTSYERKSNGLTIVYRNYSRKFMQIDKNFGIQPLSLCGVVRESNGSWVIPLMYFHIDGNSMNDSNINVIRVMSKFGTFETYHKTTGDRKRYGAIFMEPFRNGVSRLYIGGNTTLKDGNTEESIGQLINYFNSIGLNTGNAFRTARRIQRIRPENPLGYLRCENGQWAVIDKDGFYVVSPTKKKEEKFDYISQFALDYAVARKGSNYGVVNTSGIFTIPLKYDKIRQLNIKDSAVFVVRKKKEKFRFYTPDGRPLIDRSFQYAQDLNEDITWVKDKNEYKILTKGGILVQPETTPKRVKPFSENYSVVRLKKDWSIMDAKGDVTLEQGYRFIDHQSEGLFAFSTINTEKKGGVCYGYLSSDGTIEIPATFRKAHPFSNGAAIVKNKRNKLSYINRRGELLYKFKYRHLEPMNSYGWGVIRDGRRIGCIDSKGELSFKPKYQKITFGSNRIATLKNNRLVVYDFGGKEIFRLKGIRDIGALSEGKIAITQGHGGMGYFDSTGVEVIKSLYRSGEPFEGNHAIVKAGRTNMVIDDSGMVYARFLGRIKGQRSEDFMVLRKSEGGCRYIKNDNADPFGIDFDICKPINSGLGKVKTGDYWGVVDTNGMMVLPLQYDQITIGNSGIIRAGFNHEYGVFRGNGQVLVQPSYDRIYSVRQELIVLENGNDPSYLHPNGTWIWKAGNSD